MIGEAKPWMEAIEKSYQFYAYLFTLYVICMGALRWYGQTAWHKREQASRIEKGLPVANLFSGTESERGFSYSALFRGGLNGVVLLASLLGYVVWMHVFSALIEGPQSVMGTKFWELTSGLMSFPIIMAVLLVMTMGFQRRDRLRLRDCIAPVGLVVIVLAGSVRASWVFADKQIVVMCELFAVFVISLLISYLMGANEGIDSADPAEICPLVSIELIDGKSFDCVWLYERTDSDYRFVTGNGSNRIVPAANVSIIVKVADSPAAA